MVLVSSLKELRHSCLIGFFITYVLCRNRSATENIDNGVIACLRQVFPWNYNRTGSTENIIMQTKILNENSNLAKNNCSSVNSKCY